MEHVEFGWRARDGVQFYGQGWQPAGEPLAVVCLVHGQGEHSGRYAELAAALVEAGYAALALDLRGHGRSEGRRGHTPSYDAWLGDVARLLEEAGSRFPDRPRFLYGHSMGGNLVLGYALRRSPAAALAGVIASSPWLRLAFEPPAWKMTVATAMDRLWPSYAQASGLDPQSLSRDPEIVRALASDALAHDRVSARLYLSAYRAGRWALAHADAFPLPLLLMHGSADRVTAAAASRLFAERVPGDCTFKLWEGFHHELHNEPQRQDVFRFVIDWLHAHLPPPHRGTR
jgi:alpha-beta hydrolase superfamily lysophospholipase